MVDIFALRKALGSKIQTQAQSFIDNYFKPGKSDTKLQRGRDPVLGSFRLQNTTRVKVGKQGTDQVGRVRLGPRGPGRGDTTPEQQRDESPDVMNPIIANQISILDSNISKEPTQYDLRYGGGGFELATSLDPTNFFAGANGRELNPIKSDSKNSKQFIKRKLEERSHLMFEFQTPEGTKRAFLPFSENLKITESQQSNLTDYSLLSRSSQIFAYMGAESRMLKLSFSFKLLHILEMISKEGIDAKFFKHYSDFNFQNTDLNAFSGKDISSPINHSNLHRKYYDQLLNKDSYTNFRFNELYAADLTRPSEINKAKIDRTINSIIYWINLVRSSVKNDSKNTVYGPPLVRLTHGPMYNAIPCITKSFNIEIDEAAGYDAETLFPRGINVSMDLAETRIGDFSNFKSFDKIKGDNMSGWEAVFEENNMDPYNGLIRR